MAAADKLHNVRSVLGAYRAHGDAIWTHFRGGRDSTLWYYHSVLEILKQSGPTALVEELDRAIAELERLVGAER